MHNDDQPIGRSSSRRRALALFGAAAAATLATRTSAASSAGPRLAAAPDCIAIPEQREGPDIVDGALERSDIRRDPATGRITPGAPLALRFELSQVAPAGDCVLLPDARVDIWHCDAMGVYAGDDRYGSTVGEMFLRGYQVSDDHGVVRFTTIYPGWYPGRAVHIHFKVQMPAPNGRTEQFRSQLYFSDELTDRVHTRDPYSAHRGQRLLNSRDMIYREGGSRLVLPVVEAEATCTATFRIAMHAGQSRPAAPGRTPPAHGQ